MTSFTLLATDQQLEPQKIRSFCGHNDGIISAKFSPDGNLLVSTSKDNIIKIWDTNTQECLIIIKPQSPIAFADFSGDAKRILTFAQDFQSVQVWEIFTQKCLQTIKINNSEIIGGALNFDGSRILLGFSRKNRSHEFVIFETKTGNTWHRLEESKLKTLGVECSLNKKYLTVAYDNNLLKVIDFEGKCHKTIDNLKNILFFQNDQDNNRLLTVEQSNKICVRDFENSKILQEFIIGEKYIYNLHITPDKKYIFVFGALPISCSKLYSKKTTQEIRMYSIINGKTLWCEKWSKEQLVVLDILSNQEGTFILTRGLYNCIDINILPNPEKTTKYSSAK